MGWHNTLDTLDMALSIIPSYSDQYTTQKYMYRHDISPKTWDCFAVPFLPSAQLEASGALPMLLTSTQS